MRASEIESQFIIIFSFGAHAAMILIHLPVSVRGYDSVVIFEAKTKCSARLYCPICNSGQDVGSVG